MKQFIAILVFAAATSIGCHAQSFLSDLQKEKQGEGTVTVKQSADIDNLVNNAKLKNSQQQAAQQNKSNATTPAKPAAEPRHNDTATHRDSPTRQEDSAVHKQTAANEHKGSTHTEKNMPPKSMDSEPIVDTSKKMMRNSRKVTGYRIQAYSGGNSRADREKANRIGDAIKMKFPDQPVYVHFYSPRWICRVGNFRSYSEAASILKSIKAMGYTQACIVKGKITVAY